MILRDIAVPTALATPGMLVADLFYECIRSQMPGLPFRDASGRISGKASIRHILKMTCLPDYLTRHSHILGDNMDHLRLPEMHSRQVLTQTIDDFILPTLPQVNSSAPISKALAIMEQHHTTYLFIIDGNNFFGAVSIMSLAAEMLKLSADQ
jgi:CBS domain-containing protein